MNFTLQSWVAHNITETREFKNVPEETCERLGVATAPIFIDRSHLINTLDKLWPEWRDFQTKVYLRNLETGETFE